MSFTWLNKTGVRSSEGFETQGISRFTDEYKEGNKILTVFHESGKTPDGRYCEIIELSEFAEWDDGTPISLEKQKEIIKNYTDAMAFQGLGVIISE